MTATNELAPGAGSKDNERDALTATLSRPAFVAELGARAEQASQDAETFGLCLVDLDQFKNINLSHGPACGDDALRDVARRLVRTSLPGIEETTERVVGRYDGNAFAVLVETAVLKTLVAAAHVLHESVGNTPSASGASLSASVGGVLARIGEDTDSVLVRAEQALYLAKQFGRNRVEIGRSPVPMRVTGDVLPLKRSA
ncbi:MAG: diguanylate cyclase [Gammaproteobacteria bacterium]|nr:diguanylate cyclase [Gammaproteobacteria bacterium]